MQQILESEQVQVTINQVTQAMRCITVALTKNFNGSYVIQQCLKLFPADHKNVIHNLNFLLIQYIELLDFLLSIFNQFLMKNFLSGYFGCCSTKLL